MEPHNFYIKKAKTKNTPIHPLQLHQIHPHIHASIHLAVFEASWLLLLASGRKYILRTGSSSSSSYIPIQRIRVRCSSGFLGFSGFAFPSTQSICRGDLLASLWNDLAAKKKKKKKKKHSLKSERVGKQRGDKFRGFANLGSWQWLW